MRTIAAAVEGKRLSVCAESHVPAAVAIEKLLIWVPDSGKIPVGPEPLVQNVAIARQALDLLTQFLWLLYAHGVKACKGLRKWK